MQLSRWVQSHLSDEQFKNISLLPFIVTNQSGCTIAEGNVKYVVLSQHKHHLSQAVAAQEEKCIQPQGITGTENTVLIA